MKRQSTKFSNEVRVLSHKLLLPSLLALTIFLLPSNWFLKLDSSQGYVHGLQVDYLIPKLYPSIIVAGLFAAVWSLHFLKQLSSIVKRRNVAVILVLAGIILVRQIFTPEPLSSLWFFLQTNISIWFGIALYKQQKLLRHPLVLGSLVVTSCFEIILGLYQFLAQGSLAGYWLLGEGNLSQTFGLATQSFAGAERVLAYGSTPHPNILGGVLIVYLWIAAAILLKFQILSQISRYAHAFFVVLTGVSGVAVLYITQSLSAAGAAVFGILLLGLGKFNHKQTQLLLILSIGIIALTPIILAGAAGATEDPSVTRRATLNTAALSMLVEAPLVGIGINTFTRNLEIYAGSEVVRFVQPAHNVFLLILAEIGLVGGVLVAAIARLLSRRALARALLLLCIPLALDHYLYTLPQGQLLIMLALAASALTTIPSESRKTSN